MSVEFVFIFALSLCAIASGYYYSKQQAAINALGKKLEILEEKAQISRQEQHGFSSALNALERSLERKEKNLWDFVTEMKEKVKYWKQS